MKPESTNYTTVTSPFGTIVIAGAAGKIRSMRVVAEDGRFAGLPSWSRADDEFAEAGVQLAAYFSGKLRTFSLPLELLGTPFQQRAWQILRDVPYGSTTTYGEIANKMGCPNASRAVGGAMNRNPITIIVPCHRVVGKNGALTGYLNGTDMKRRLLEMEAAN